MLLFGGLIGLFYALLEHRFSQAVLRILNGEKRGKEYSFAGNRLLIGTDHRCDIVLDAYQGVLPQHARIRVKKDGVYLDNGSSAGPVYINDRAMKGERPLKYEDVLKIGSAKLIYRPE